jgi:hypothetical protein
MVHPDALFRAPGDDECWGLVCSENALAHRLNV